MKRRTRRTKRGEEEVVAQERWRPNVLYLLGAALVLSVVAALFLRDHQGQRLGLPGAYVWVTGLLLAFGLHLADLARFVLPPQSTQIRNRMSAFVGESGSWQEGMRMLVYYFVVLALPETLRQRFAPRQPSIPPPLPQSFAQFEAGFVDSHLALALSRGTGFSRAAGPGYVRLQSGERISEVVDLRRQMRRRTVEAMTRDGIMLQTTIAVTFRIRQLPSDSARSPEGAVPYPYDPDNIFRLTYADGAGPSSEIPWSARIFPQAASLLIAEIARYRLDQLYRPTTAQEEDAVPLTRIVNDVQKQLIDDLPEIFDCGSADDCPVEILNVSIGQFQPPDEVVEQRVNNWRGAWERRMERQEAEATVSLEEARTIAMKELVESVTRDIAPGDTGELSKSILLNVSGLMEKLVDGGAPLPPQINTTNHGKANSNPEAENEENEG